MDTVDTRLQRIADAIRALEPEEREDTLDELEHRLTGETLLSPEQETIVRERLSKPRQYATPAQVEEVFARYRVKR